MAKRATRNYVNNKDLLEALIAYQKTCREAEDVGDDRPRVPDYIGECIYQIATRLATKPNFSGYSYKEDMISDGIENCLLYINNFNPEKSQNPFAYFTQIIWYAFLRRIQKEKKQQDLKLRFIAESGLDEFMVDPDEDPEVAKVVQNFVEGLRRRIDDVKEKDEKFATYKKKTISNRRKSTDSDLTEMFEDDE